MSAAGTSAQGAGAQRSIPQGSSAQGTVRRLIVFILLFALVVIAAIGVAGLLGRLVDSGAALAGGSDDLALLLAYTLIGGPLAALLWWFTWRRLDEDAERASIAWGLYLTAMLTLALIVTTVVLAGVLAALVDGRWEPADLANAVVWALVWVWHAWMLRHPSKAPRRMAAVPVVLGAAYGLVVGAIGAIGAAGGILDTAIDVAGGRSTVGTGWWVAPLQSLAWALVGAAAWWIHWVLGGASRTRTAFAGVALVLVGVLAAAAAALGGLGTALFVGLRLAFDPGDLFAAVVQPLGTAVAAALIGAAVWRVHAGIAATRSPAVRRAATLA
ncbi:DUF5671 domain-containing protein, partial [Agromyces seonyuensis]|nr:hypothetical protein [Agromyces seonyuensis]